MWGDTVSEYDDAGKIVAASGDSDRAKRRAKHKSKRAQMKGWEANMRVVGNPVILSKQTATLEQCGKILDGDWRISSVRHEISASGYTCSLKLIRPEAQVTAENTAPSSSSAGNSGSAQAGNTGSNSGDDEEMTINVG